MGPSKTTTVWLGQPTVWMVQMVRNGPPKGCATQPDSTSDGCCVPYDQGTTCSQHPKSVSMKRSRQHEAEDEVQQLEDHRVLSVNINQWVGRVHEQGLQQLLPNGLRRQRLVRSERSVVRHDLFWDSACNFPSLDSPPVRFGLLGQLQCAVATVLQSDGECRILQAVGLSIGFLRRLAWDVVVDPLSSELAALDEWLEELSGSQLVAESVIDN